MSKKNTRKTKPKSQSEKAADKKARALEKAGDAALAGDKKKAAKLAKKATEPKKPSKAQAVEALLEARAIEMQITAIDHQIDAVKEKYKSLKSDRERLVLRLREEIRDGHQARFPFSSAAVETKEGSEGAKPAATPTPGETQGQLPGTAAPSEDEVDRELAGRSVLDDMEAAGSQDDLERAADRAPRSKDRKTKSAVHQRNGAAV